MFFYKQLFTPQQLRHLPWFYDFMNSLFKTLYNCAKFTSVYLMQYVWICNSHYSDQIKWHENVFWQWYLSRFLWSQRIFFRITILTLRPIRLPKRLLPCQKIANPESLFFLRKKTEIWANKVWAVKYFAHFSWTGQILLLKPWCFGTNPQNIFEKLGAILVFQWIFNSLIDL